MLVSTTDICGGLSLRLWCSLLLCKAKNIPHIKKDGIYWVVLEVYVLQAPLCHNICSSISVMGSVGFACVPTQAAWIFFVSPSRVLLRFTNYLLLTYLTTYTTYTMHTHASDTRIWKKIYIYTLNTVESNHRDGRPYRPKNQSNTSCSSVTHSEP